MLPVRELAHTTPTSSPPAPTSRPSPSSSTPQHQYYVTPPVTPGGEAEAVATRWFISLMNSSPTATQSSAHQVDGQARAEEMDSDKYIDRKTITQTEKYTDRQIDGQIENYRLPTCLLFG